MTKILNLCPTIRAAAAVGCVALSACAPNQPELRQKCLVQARENWPTTLILEATVSSPSSCPIQVPARLQNFEGTLVVVREVVSRFTPLTVSVFNAAGTAVPGRQNIAFLWNDCQRGQVLAVCAAPLFNYPPATSTVEPESDRIAFSFARFANNNGSGTTLTARGEVLIRFTENTLAPALTANPEAMPGEFVGVVADGGNLTRPITYA